MANCWLPIRLSNWECRPGARGLRSADSVAVCLWSSYLLSVNLCHHLLHGDDKIIFHIGFLTFKKHTQTLIQTHAVPGACGCSTNVSY